MLHSEYPVHYHCADHTCYPNSFEISISQVQFLSPFSWFIHSVCPPHSYCSFLDRPISTPLFSGLKPLPQVG